MATSSKGTSGEVPRVSFDGKDAPIRSVVVYTNNMAQIKRVVNFSANARGLHEVILVVDDGAHAAAVAAVELHLLPVCARSGGMSSTRLQVNRKEHLTKRGTPPKQNLT